MKNITPLIIAALLVSLLAGCSKHPKWTKAPDPIPLMPASAHPTYTDFGTVEVANDKKTRHDMSDGRVFILDSFILTGQRIALIMAIEEHTNGAVQLITCPNIQAVSDQAVEFAVGDIGVRFTPHIKP
jgi:hypothetical protein